MPEIYSHIISYSLKVGQIVRLWLCGGGVALLQIYTYGIMVCIGVSEGF